MSAAREEEEEEEPASLLLRLEPTASRLAAICRLDLRKAGLKRLPASIGLCATCLEQLDVGGNPLESLDGVQTLGRLRVLFATGCALGGRGLPAGGPLSRADSLFMLSLKENGLAVLDGEALPPKLGWLICAQNAIAEVRAPHRLSHVRKLMLSHNLLDAVSADLLIEAIPALEMLRLACNRMETLPAAAFRHPRLAWFAFGGNPYSARLCAAALSAADAAADAVATLKDASEAGREVAVGEEELGRGSGAVVKRGTWQGTPVACKLWSAELFSDGDARGEWLMGRLTGGCASLVRTLAAWETPSLGMAVVKLSDLGAACAYDRHGHTAVEKLEVRSFGLLLLDLLSHLQVSHDGTFGGGEAAAAAAALRHAAAACTAESLEARPSFAELCAEL
ncbi:hypothetical protein EMIHUDRAFT_119876 [Emiliania huxleyi CCMP1516]|uniref:Protein kinase domain-containing protein n=2 Tax=Emiliania huxleyi TaxID=2903 RepID=A0A0D3IPZ3_EMIH1|nr:hypothetical protein EMIHUDRAFT_119876 [Emiliania huxleyi CCMP1516]EOD13328.1 hypothetical protein EMIHUDRAFT_119876 [Emiliania huxleyi CCMP1516]|eukprot:XP_005765757.1 hypothetical protein EMIHUDRAFT_119876 [Emiliania huxleyi CCMP1516]